MNWENNLPYTQNHCICQWWQTGSYEPNVALRFVVLVLFTEL